MSTANSNLAPYPITPVPYSANNMAGLTFTTSHGSFNSEQRSRSPSITPPPPLFHQQTPSFGADTPSPMSPSGLTTADNRHVLFADGLAKDFQLEPQQRARLHMLVKLGSICGGLTEADLTTRLYMAAMFLADAADRRRVAKEQGIGDLKDLFNDLKIRLEDTFTFTAEQKSNIRCIAQDVIYQANRTAFKTMHFDVEKKLKEDAIGMKLSNVYGSPTREKLLLPLVKTISSSVRNAFRQDIRDSIHGTKACSLADFTYRSAVKFKRGGPGEHLDNGFTVHNVILRRFGLENLDLLFQDEEDELAEGEPGAKKRKVSPRVGGRIPKGQDFWARLDAFFIEAIELNGRNLAGPKWQAYVDESIIRDNAQFDRNSGSSTEPLSSDLIPRTPTSDLGFGSTTNIQGEGYLVAAMYGLVG